HYPGPALLDRPPPPGYNRVIPPAAVEGQWVQLAAGPGGTSLPLRLVAQRRQQPGPDGRLGLMPARLDVRDRDRVHAGAPGPRRWRQALQDAQGLQQPGERQATGLAQAAPAEQVAVARRGRRGGDLGAAAAAAHTAAAAA